jgi:Na+-transporting NADH:ubiquinone oxidoreductase subunit NqrB
MVQQKNLVSNLSSDIKDIKKFSSEQVRLLKSLGQGFSKTTTQASFTSLGVFFLGITLVIYGLRLTLKGTDRRTSRFFKAMMWGLITPVIALIALYQIGIPIYKSDDSFFFISVLLMIPAAIIIFLLIAERRLISGSIQKDQQRRQP